MECSILKIKVRLADIQIFVGAKYSSHLIFLTFDMDTLFEMDFLLPT